MRRRNLDAERVLTFVENRPVGGAAENLDWLNGQTEAPAVLDRTTEAQRDFDPRLVVPADVGVQGRDELSTVVDNQFRE